MKVTVILTSNIFGYNPVEILQIASMISVQSIGAFFGGGPP